MEAASTSRRSLGDILVDRGLITQEHLERALAEEFATKRRLADVLVRRGLVTGHDITDALVEQMRVFSGDAASPRPLLKAVDADAEDQSTPEEIPAPEAEPEDESQDTAARVELDPGPSPATPVEPTTSVPVLSMSPEDVIRETDERRLTAESRMSMLGGIGEGLERIRAELEAQELTTPPLVRELEATQERVRAREEALSDEIAQLQRRREAVEGTSAELDQLRADLGAKLNDLSNLKATAAMWNDRVAELEAEVNSQVERIDALSRELALLVDGAPHTPAMHAVTEIHPQLDPESEVEAEPETAADAEVAWAGAPAVAASGETHLLFVPQNDTYDLVERAGPPPAVGESIELDGSTWVVTEVGSSPRPFDERVCVFFSAS